ncbi:MAG: M24 family metallopeptidase, partial [Gemmatimonadales bacterium]
MPRPPAADRRRERQAALAAVLAAEGLDALLVTSRSNIRYLTGFSGSAGVAVVPCAAGTGEGGEVLLVTDSRYDEQAHQQCGAVARVEIEAASVWERLFTVLPSLGGLAALGYEAHALSAKDAARLPDTWQWKPAGELVERLRARKDPGEVAAIRAAAALAGAALQETLAAVRPAGGQTELEIAGLLEHALRRRGSEGHPFATIVASGPRTAWPHAQTSARPVQRGDWLLLDFGAVVDGYCADVTRTVLVGARADDAQRGLYDLVAAAQRRAREGVR